MPPVTQPTWIHDAKAPLSLVALMTLTVSATAQQPGKITSGATGVMVDGKPAARVGDTTTDGKIIEGAKGVYINGKPAAVVGGSTECGGKTISGSNWRVHQRQADGPCRR